MGFDQSKLEALRSGQSGVSQQLLALFSVLPEMYAYTQKLPPSIQSGFLQNARETLDEIPIDALKAILREMEQAGELDNVIRYSAVIKSISARWRKQSARPQTECPQCGTRAGYIPVWNPSYLLWHITGREGFPPPRHLVVACPSCKTPGTALARMFNEVTDIPASLPLEEATDAYINSMSPPRPENLEPEPDETEPRSAT
jgi:hypothetical protein